MHPLNLVMEEKRFATVMWGGFDFIADAGGSDPDRQEWLMECSGLQASSSNIYTTCLTTTRGMLVCSHLSLLSARFAKQLVDNAAESKRKVFRLHLVNTWHCSLMLS